MCENLKLGLLEKEAKGADFLGSLEKASGGKGKEVALDGSGDEGRRWVERDFLQLGGTAGFKGHGKREAVKGSERDADSAGEDRGKKPKIETLNLSLGQPTLSLSLNSSIPIPRPVAAAAAAMAPEAAAPPPRTSRSRSLSLAPTPCHTIPAALSHVTRRSTASVPEIPTLSTTLERELMGLSTADSDPSEIAANNSVTFSNHCGYPRLRGSNKDSDNGLYQANGSENNSFPSELLPAAKDLVKPGGSDGGRNLVFSRPEQIMKEIILEEPVPMVAQMLRDIPTESVEATRDFLTSLMKAANKWDDSRGDLT